MHSNIRYLLPVLLLAFANGCGSGGGNSSTPTTSLAISVSTLAVSVNNPTLNAALSGKPRSLTITNTGSMPATDVGYSVSPALPSGTTITPATCGTLAAGATCVLTITPGSTPSAVAGDTGPVPVTLSIAGSNTSASAVAVHVLTYGSVYQGGYVFAVDDSTSADSSVLGKVAALTDQSTGVVWSADANGSSVNDDIDGTDDQDSIPCVGKTEGACNTSQIRAFYPATSSTAYAGGVCSATIEGYTDWYLPALCEMSYESSGGGTCGLESAPVLQNMQSSLADGNVGNLDNLYWSSTAPSGDPEVFAWVYQRGPSMFTTGKSSHLGVRCARALTP